MLKKFDRILLFIGCISYAACKLNPDSSRDYTDKNKTYKLHLNPVVGSKYHFDISNQSEVKIEVDGKKINNVNRSNAGVFYKVDKDSLDNVLLTINYDKIHVYTKTGETETEIDAGQAKATLNPAERALGYLKDAPITATISPLGEVKKITGYDAIGDKIIASFAANDVTGKKIAQEQWNKTIGEGLVKKNMDDLFRIFPDSAAHIGDSWQLTSQNTGAGLQVKNIFRLKAINGDVAIIQSEGIIMPDNSETTLANAMTDLKGKQYGDYEIDTKTGMLISCKQKANVEGTISTMGQEVPVKIEIIVKIVGHKVK